jgi:hypothetical protein
VQFPAKLSAKPYSRLSDATKHRMRRPCLVIAVKRMYMKEGDGGEGANENRSQASMVCFSTWSPNVDQDDDLINWRRFRCWHFNQSNYICLYLRLCTNHRRSFNKSFERRISGCCGGCGNVLENPLRCIMGWMSLREHREPAGGRFKERPGLSRCLHYECRRHSGRDLEIRISDWAIQKWV